MVRAGQSGMIYDFLCIVLSTVLVPKNLESVESVLRFTEQLPKDQNYRLFFDN